MSERVEIACPSCRAVVVVEGDVRPGSSAVCTSCGREIAVPEPRQASTLLAGGASPTENPAIETATVDTGSRLRLAHAMEALPARYSARGSIGRGGMGEVLVCLDQDTRRQVALKRMLPATAADARRRARFVEEAQVTAQLEHPNIVPVYELGQDEQGNAYYTMRLVRGKSLSAVLRSGPDVPRLGEMLEVFLKICDAVGFAHSKGVVHRDLKPDNVMVGEFGEALVMDWGLAKVLASPGERQEEGSRQEAGGSRQGKTALEEPLVPTAACGLPTGGPASQPPVPSPSSLSQVETDRREAGLAPTLEGTTVGTPAYMAPEQATGRTSEVGPRSDIYSLGAILYQMLTLERPVDEPTVAATLQRVADGRIVPPEQRAPGRHVPRELSAVVMKAMARSPAHRYGSVAELRRDVSLFLEGRSVSAAPDTFAQALVKLVRRNKAISTAVVAAVAVLAAVTVVYLMDLREQRDEARRARGIAEIAQIEADDARLGERRVAVTASKGFAEEAIRAAEMGRWGEAERRAKDADDVALNSPWGVYARGVFARMRNDHKAAADLFRQAANAEPYPVEAKAALAEAEGRLQELEAAERLAANVGQMTDWRELLKLGRTLHDAGRWKDCQVPFERAVERLEKERGALPAPPDERSRELLRQLDAARYSLDAARARAACAGFETLVRSLAAEEQVKRVQAKLSEVNGIEVQVGGIVIANGQWVEANLAHQDQPSVRFLYPFQGVPLSKLNLRGTGVRDLSQLRGLPLTWLDCGDTPASDLSPLKSLPLRSLFIGSDRVSDLSPLAGMDIELLCFRPQSIRKGIDAIRAMRSLKKIGDRWDALASPEEFWRRYDAGEFRR